MGAFAFFLGPWFCLLYIHLQDVEPAGEAVADVHELPVIDDLPHYKSLPKLFGGNDELVGW